MSGPTGWIGFLVIGYPDSKDQTFTDLRIPAVGQSVAVESCESFRTCSDCASKEQCGWRNADGICQALPQSGGPTGPTISESAQCTNILDACNAAITATVGNDINDSTVGSVADDNLDSSCDSSTTSSPAKFYFFDGSDEVIQFSTCHPETMIDAQLAVFEADAAGTCNRLACLDFSLQDCPANNKGSILTVRTFVGLKLVLRVSGNAAAESGSFKLTTTVVTPDTCQAAVELTANGKSSAYHGRFPSSASLDSHSLCGASDQSYSSAWFFASLPPSTVVQISACNQADSTSVPHIDVFSSSAPISEPKTQHCLQSALSCADSSRGQRSVGCTFRGGTTSFITGSMAQDVTSRRSLYIIRLRGPPAGLYSISLTADQDAENQINSCPLAPRIFEFVDMTTGADPALLGVNNGVLQLSSTAASDFTVTQSCLFDDALTTASFGSWFHLIGDGSVWSISTCNPQSNFDTVCSPSN